MKKEDEDINETNLSFINDNRLTNSINLNRKKNV